MCDYVKDEPCFMTAVQRSNPFLLSPPPLSFLFPSTFSFSLFLFLFISHFCFIPGTVPRLRLALLVLSDSAVKRNMTTDVLTATASPSHIPLPRGLAIPDLDLRDDRYPIISPSRHFPPLVTQQGAPSPDIIPSHSPYYPDVVHQALRGPSPPSSGLPPYNLNTLKLASSQLDVHQVPDDRRFDHSNLLNAGSPPNSFPLDHKQPTNVPSSLNEINLRLFGPSQTSQASSGEVSKGAPAAGDSLLPSQQPRPLRPISPWQTSLQDPQQLEPYTLSPRSGGPSQTQGSALPSPLSPGMRISNAAQYSPAMAVPVTISSNPRVQAQQPTYITPTLAAPKPVKPVFTTQPLPAEEVCVECAMRDQDMADVDVTSFGIWARESDVHYDELLRRELEEEAMGVPPPELRRPRARGGRLTESNLKLWLALVRWISLLSILVAITPRL